MKLMAGVNFTNILCADFTHANPNSAKRYWQCDCVFALLGSAHVKALHRMLMKSTPECWSRSTIGSC